MKIVVRSPTSRRSVKISSPSDLEDAIKKAFEVEEFQLFSDSSRKTPLDTSKLSDGSVIYMNYERDEPKFFKEENTCTHPPEGVCPKCASLDPLDRLKKEGERINVRYMSYDSYKEALKRENKAESEFNYETKICKDHPKNAKCMKCMDKVIILSPQIYRPIDYVAFDNKECVEEFIKKWRNSDRQQIGLLVGRILPHKDLPLAKKAVVSGIWEIEQEKFPDGAVLRSLPDKFICDELEIVGLIYTDLFLKDSAIFSYKKKYDYVISAMELNFIYEVQAHIKRNEFVGICVSADGDDEIGLECFMLSEQFKALMKAKTLELTTKPEYFTTQKSIKYLEKNEYDKAVHKDASPYVPVYYFFVKCEAGYSNVPLFKSTESVLKPTIARLAKYFNNEFGFEKFQSFSILMAVAKNYPGAGELVSAVIKNDSQKFEEISKRDDFNSFIEKMCAEYEGTWNCLACTYINSSHSRACELCNTERAQQ